MFKKFFFPVLIIALITTVTIWATGVVGKSSFEALYQSAKTSAQLAGETSKQTFGVNSFKCWIKLFEGPDFSGKVVHIWGPESLNELSWEREDLGGEPKSIRVGWSASAYLYTDENYSGERIFLDRGESVVEVMFPVGSIDLSCEPYVQNF